MRACALTGQEHVISYLGLDPRYYREEQSSSSKGDEINIPVIQVSVQRQLFVIIKPFEINTPSI